MPWAGTSPSGWQFAQRGWRRTLFASRNRARDRSFWSDTTAKSATGRSWFAGTDGNAGVWRALHETIASARMTAAAERIRDDVIAKTAAASPGKRPPHGASV